MSAKSQTLSSEAVSTWLLISKLLPLCMVLTFSIVEALDVAYFWSSTSLELLVWFSFDGNLVTNLKLSLSY